MFFSRFEYRMLYVLYPFVTYFSESRSRILPFTSEAEFHAHAKHQYNYSMHYVINIRYV
jgi:hypothetical protein